jgi:hypothetical protein
MSDTRTWKDIQKYLKINKFCEFYLLLQACPKAKQHNDFTNMGKTFSYATKAEA